MGSQRYSGKTDHMAFKYFFLNETHRKTTYYKHTPYKKYKNIYSDIKNE